MAVGGRLCMRLCVKQSRRPQQKYVVLISIPTILHVEDNVLCTYFRKKQDFNSTKASNILEFISFA